MLIQITHPRWSNTCGLFDTIKDIVFQEGGDGWCWVQCKDPQKMSRSFVEHFNTTSEQKMTIERFNDNDYVVRSPYSREEHWFFTTFECNSPYYEAIVWIKD